MKWQTWLILFLLLTSGGAAVYNMTRGIRNKNPGNIRFNLYNDWKGQIGQDDAGFVRFSDSKYGIRAMGKTLDSYHRRGVKTIREIVSTWAPAEENNTESYVRSVVNQTGFHEAFIPYREHGHYLPLIRAIIRHENGVNPYSDDDIEDALSIA